MPKPVAAAIDNGLRWLARHQDKDGRFDVDGFMKHDPTEDRCSGPGNPAEDIGVTAIALLTFLADGHTLNAGEYRENVSKGVAWLVKQQQSDGKFQGLIGSPSLTTYIYNHLFATFALLEAYGLSQAKEYQLAATKAVKYVEAHRHPDFGWHYRNGDRRQDTSVNVLAWTVLYTADKFGIKSQPSHPAVVRAWLDATTHQGVVGYSRPGELSARHSPEHATKFPVQYSQAMTAAGAFGRFLLGDQNSPGSPLSKSVSVLLDFLPRWQPERGAVDLYYWVYGSLVMRQAGGEEWTRWSARLHQALLAGQETTGSAKGSWPAVSVWSVDGGRVYATAMALLCLQAEYRFAFLADLTPIPKDMPAFRRARARWKAEDFAGVKTALDKLAAKPENLSDAQRSVIAAATAELSAREELTKAEIRELRKGPDFHASKARLTIIEKQHGKLAAGLLAAEALREFNRSSEISKEIRAMTELHRIMDKTPVSKRRVALTKLINRYKDTFAAKKASEYRKTYR